MRITLVKRAVNRRCDAPKRAAAFPQAVAYAVLSTILFTLTVVPLRSLSRELGALDIVIYRDALSIPLIVFFDGLTHRFLLRQPRRMRWPSPLFAQAGLRASSFACWSIGLTTQSASVAICLFATKAIWIVVASRLLTGERLSSFALMCLLAGLLGVLIVASPEGGHINLGTILVIVAAMIGAVANIHLSGSATSDPPVSVTFRITVVELAICLPFAALAGLHLPTLNQIPILAVLGVLIAGSHALLTSAFRLASVSSLAMIEFVRLPLSLLVSTAVFHDPLPASFWAGAALIALSNMLAVRERTGPKRIALSKERDP